MVNFLIAVLALLVLGLAGSLIALSMAHVRSRRLCERLNAELTSALRESQHRQSALDERKELDTIKDEFISTVSHELRTPLTSIRGALGLLSSGLMGKLDDKAANLLRIASTNTDRLVRLINDILDLERMESGRAPLHIRHCALHELVLQSVDTMTALAEAAHVRLVIVPEPAGDPIVFDGDPDRVQQVLCNLLSNAIKFSPAGSSVRVLTGIDGPNFVLRVEDVGRGVPQDKIESIFDRFGQVEPGDARQKGGTGLGLAICRSIVASTPRNHLGGAQRRPRHRTRRNNLLPAHAPHRCCSRCCRHSVRRRDPRRRRRRPPRAALSPTFCISTATPCSKPAAASRPCTWPRTTTLRPSCSTSTCPACPAGRPSRSSSKTPRPQPSPSLCSAFFPPPATGTEDRPLVANTQGWIQKPFNESLLLAELGRVLHAGTGPGRILLVEDDFDLATVVLAGFEAENAQVSVTHVSSVGEAQLACRTEPPDILILDLTLPDGSGFALVDWLRGQPALRTLPLVVYSGRDVTPTEMEQLRLGPTQFLAKARVQPRDVEDLVLAMVRHLRTPAATPPSA